MRTRRSILALGALALASGGVGSTGHMSAELFQMMAGIKFTHVPYRGEAPALTDLIAGQAQLMVSTTGSSLQYAKAGTVRALATTTDDRVAELPDVPSLVEAGYPNLDVPNWFGLFVPAATPAPIAQRLSVALATVTASASCSSRGAPNGAHRAGSHGISPANAGGLPR